MCPVNPLYLLHHAYCRESTDIFPVSNQYMNSGLLGLLCPVSKWSFPSVCSSSDGLSINDRVLVGLSFLHSNRILFLSLKPSPCILRKPRPHGEATCRYYGDSPSQGLSWPPASTMRHVSKQAADDSRPQPLSWPSWCWMQQRQAIPAELWPNCRFVSEITSFIVFSH